MGVPAFFRWLSKKYPSIIVHCVEEKGKIIDGVTIPVDCSQANPNDVEFDNLYLDMNGIIHPCCHPENKPAPKNEDEMMVLIFEYIDRIFSIVRPRRLLYMAIDGVAPRAKMNQQRSRRFRAAKESKDKREEIARLKEEMRAKGLIVPPDKPASEHFDSNCITPGTPFMFRLADCLRYYVHDRLNNDPGWKNIKVILSDANVPGEGEHKIMDYIRKQRAQPDHDPNTHHCLCGADADLIMLGLATHEPYFTIIREEFKPNQDKPCEICGQIGHEMKECMGLAREGDEVEKPIGSETDFIFIRLPVLREYLQRELSMPNLPFKEDFERALDDWVFMCFFVGNDFLPHLPSLEIRENAIDRLVNLYKKAVYKTGGYITDSGLVNLARVQLVLTDLGEVEDEIFKKRRETELGFRQRAKIRRRRNRQTRNVPKFMSGGQFAPSPIGSGSNVISNPRQAAYQGRMHARSYSSPQNLSNQQAADALKSMMSNGSKPGSFQSSPGSGQKRKASEMEDSDSDPEPQDEVKLWEDGWKDRYYTSKFGVDQDDIKFRHLVANEYVIGLCWVLRYYYQGCASWKWYFPYHYAPFASDFINISGLPTDFEKNTKPFKPLEQLMGVFPAASKDHLPPSWQLLMYEPDSPIIDFYPTNFRIDLNGKKYAWQGVALLPFVEEARLKEALIEVYPDLTEDERARNIWGHDRLFVGGDHPVHSLLEGLYEQNITKEEEADLDPSLTKGVRGKIWTDKDAVMTDGTVVSPLSCLKHLEFNRTIMVAYSDPKYSPDYIFPAKVLPGAKMPEKTLKPEDFDQRNPGERFRPTLGFGGPNKGYPPPLMYDSSSAKRHIRHNLGGQGRDQRQHQRSFSHGEGSRNYAQQGNWQSSNQRQSSNDPRGYGERGWNRDSRGHSSQNYGNQGYGNQGYGSHGYVSYGYQSYSGADNYSSGGGYQRQNRQDGYRQQRSSDNRQNYHQQSWRRY